MKKYFLFSISAVLIVAGSMFLQSCENNSFSNKVSVSEPLTLDELASNEFIYFGEVIRLRDGELKWRRQLSLIKENNHRIEHNGLTFDGYRYIGRISSIAELEKIKSKIFKNPIFPVYHSPGNFELSKTAQFSNEEFTSFLGFLIPTSKCMMIDTRNSTSSKQFLFEENDMSIVELKWSYKGARLTTIALVSDSKGVVYDHLLYFIHFVEPKIESYIVAIDTTSRLRSGRVECSERPDGSFNFFFSASDEITNLLSRRVFVYNITATIPFTRHSGVVSIESFSFTRSSSGYFGWYGYADIRSISVQMGVGGHVHFAWGFVYGTDRSLGLTWKGTGFVASGFGSRTTGGGEEFVNAFSINNQ